MTLMIKPENQSRPNFVGIASGIDLRNPQDEETIQAIDRAMDQYAVLVFRGQPLTQDEQIEYSQQFGPLDSGLRTTIWPIRLWPSKGYRGAYTV